MPNKGLKNVQNWTLLSILYEKLVFLRMVCFKTITEAQGSFAQLGTTWEESDKLAYLGDGEASLRQG